MIVAVKTIHLGCALLSFSGFVLRGWWMFRGSPLAAHRLARIVPHVIDAGLLFSGIALAVAWHVAGLPLDWLVLKLAAVVAYIILGFVALHRGRSRAGRTAAFAAALLVFAGIVYLAHGKPLAGG